jgi:archaellum component FlaC
MQQRKTIKLLNGYDNTVSPNAYDEVAVAVDHNGKVIDFTSSGTAGVTHAEFDPVKKNVDDLVPAVKDLTTKVNNVKVNTDKNTSDIQDIQNVGITGIKENIQNISSEINDITTNLNTLNNLSDTLQDTTLPGIESRFAKIEDSLGQIVDHINNEIQPRISQNSLDIVVEAKRIVPLLQVTGIDNTAKTVDVLISGLKPNSGVTVEVTHPDSSGAKNNFTADDKGKYVGTLKDFTKPGEYKITATVDDYQSVSNIVKVTFQ